MALLQSTTISGSNANTGSLSITGSTMVFPIIESSLTGSFSGSGKMWVNADGQTLQYSLNTSLGTVNSPASFMGAWSTGGSLSIARYAQSQGVYGTQNAGLSVGGRAPSFTSTTANEEYNGSAWSTGGALINATHVGGGAGTQNDAFTAGGYQNSGFCSFSEEYNGSAWSAGGTLISTTGYRAGAGSSTAGIIFNCSTTTEEYNGSSWSTGGNIIITGRESVGIGTQNDALSLNNDTGGSEKNFQQYDGSSWALGNNSNQNHQAGYGAGSNTYEVLLSGGAPEGTETTNVEEWNGTSWATSNTLITKQACGASGGSQAAAYIAGGESPSTTAVTQEYTKDFIAPYTTCVWTSGGGMITPRSQGAGGGTNNAALVAGGGTPTRVSCTEEWDGNQWSAGGALSITRSALAGGGTQNAGWVAGGEPAGGTATEEYNGTSWASGGTLAIGGYGKRGGGPQTAAQVITGTPNPRVTNQTYDGTTWTSATSMPAARSAAALTGTCAASIVDGGSPYTTTAILWNGSSWSETGTKTTCTSGNQMGGTQNDALSFGGYNPANPNSIVSTEHYDGSSWSVQGNLSVASKYGAGAATSPAGAVDSFYAGGYNTAVIGNMQLYNAVCSATLCSSLPVWSGATQLLSGVSYGGGFGTQNAAVVATGIVSPTAAYFGSQEYDGSTWTTGGTTNCQTGEGYGRAGAGTQNAGLLFGGWPAQNWTEKYDGSAWTTANAMITTAYGRGGSGTQNAALAAGKGPAPVSAATEEFDGTNWSSGGSLSIARYAGLSAGTQNNTVYAAGTTNSALQTATEEYNGSSWSTGGSLSISGGFKDEAGFQMFGEGAYSAVITGGRTPTKIANTDEYNGSTWSVRPQLPLALSSVTRIGTSNAGLTAGGRSNATNQISNVFEYNNNTNTCVGVWSIGPNTSVTGTRELGFGGVGTQNAAALFSGRISPANITCTEEYNGSSWSAGGANITARYLGSNTGTQNAGLLVGGNTAGSCVSCTEEYDGSSWASGVANSRGVDFLTSIGTQNAAVSFGGRGSTPSVANFTCTQFYDGTSWTAKNSLSTGRYGSGGVGTQNSALAFGGYCNNNGPGYQTGCPQTEEWDGTNWSTKQNLLFATGAGNTAGTVNNALMIGGYLHPAASSYNQSWDGTAWSMTQNLLASAARFGSGGSGNAAIAAKGYSGMGVALWNVNQLGAGNQNWIGKVNFVTE